ncbi:hypothetical protein [Streptomyces sp. WM6378]|uniref:hypothetical protein n=1 Tax=Streptomyces sp. WM6378 TaxID=1415557 RepID=UPI00099D4890|nr:hypothetical protein [Streptomyces sp. WM6378]
MSHRALGPSPADQQLIDHASQHGHDVSAKQLATWRRAGLLPGNTVSFPGRGGSASEPVPAGFDLVVGLARHAGRGRRPDDLALLLFGDGLPVSEARVRAAFGAAVGRIHIAAENAETRNGGPEEHAAQVADRAVGAGLSVVLVPARVRRIDERLTRHMHGMGLPWPPPELAALDRNPHPTPCTPQEATAASVYAVLLGGASVTPQGIGDLVRAMNPGMPGNPLASLAEYTDQDVPDGPTAFRPEGGMTTIPEGDVRDVLQQLVVATPLDDLHAAWMAAEGIRDWAWDLCKRVEAELDAGKFGEALAEWAPSRTLLASISLLTALRNRRWSPADHATSALYLLLMRQGLRALDEQIPGCQWEILDTPGMLPPPLKPLLRM